MIKLFTILTNIIKELRANDAMLEKPVFLRKFLYDIVEGSYGESTLTYRDVYVFMEQVEGDMIRGDYGLINKLDEIYQSIRSIPSDESLQELEDLVKGPL